MKRSATRACPPTVLSIFHNAAGALDAGFRGYEIAVQSTESSVSVDMAASRRGYPLRS